MKRPASIACSVSALVAALLLADGAAALDALNGKRLYHDVGRLRGAGVSCVDCHFALPGQFGISRAANDPARIQQAVESIPQMTPLRGRLTSDDYKDLAAYIGQPGVPSPDLRVSTSGAASDRIDFGTVTAGTSASAQMRLDNGGAIALRLTSLPRIVGEHPADFTFGPGGTCPGAAALAAGATCVIEVRFAPLPGATGTRRAALQVDHDWIGGVAAVALLGQAQPAGSPAAVPIGAPATAGGGGGATAAGGLIVLLAALWVRRRVRAPASCDSAPRNGLLERCA
jgi:cytochrome c553